MPGDPQELGLMITVFYFTLGMLAIPALMQYEARGRPGARELFPLSLEAVPTFLGMTTGFVALMGSIHHVTGLVGPAYVYRAASWLGRMSLPEVLTLAVATPIFMWAPRAVRRVRGPPADVDG
jgi:hypothetical protein